MRDGASFGLPGIHRIAVPTGDQLDRLMTALVAITDGRPQLAAP